MPIGFGIIGAGMISRFHAKAIKEVKGAKLVTCTDSSFAKAEALAKEFGCTPYDSVEAMVADPAVDAVTIATAQRRPHGTRRHRREGGQACHRREAARDHAQACG